MCLFNAAVSAADGDSCQLPEILLWPDGMPAPVVPGDPPEKLEIGTDGLTRRFHVSRPRLIVHLPPPEAVRSSAGVIVIPGGGFGRLADEHEGSDACRWLAAQGIVAFQLAYRTPTLQHAEPCEGPVQDAQQALIAVRRRGSEFGLDGARIGVLGFSAGAQVALIAATNDLKVASSDGAATAHRPNFLMAIYPFRILDPATNSLRPDIRPDAGLPPTFIAQMGDDTASLPQGSVQLYLELVSRRVPAELHIYERGGHGAGMRTREGATGPTDWPHRATDWLRLHGLTATPP